jgi:uncharacterized protein (DUF4415 family)
MKKQHTENIIHYKLHELPVDHQTDWEHLKNLSALELEKNAFSDPDTFIADKKFWEAAQWVMPSEAGKERITIRLDADVLDWLKQKGRGYQSRINAILRAFMNTSQHSRPHDKHHMRHKKI